MRYSGIIYNDFAAAPGVCLTFFTQGCPQPFHCKGCHNPETWDFSGGREFTDKTLASIIKGLTANGIKRNLCIMGGEPLCSENRELTAYVIMGVKAALPDTKIYVWTGYTYKQLLEIGAKEQDENLATILYYTNTIIDGQYVEEERDITLFMRGSRNQRVLELHKENN